MIHPTIDLTHKVTPPELELNPDALMELLTTMRRTNRLFDFLFAHPVMPFKTVHYINTQAEDAEPQVHLWAHRWREAFQVFGADGWIGPDFETSRLSIKKMVDGIEVRIDGLETEAAQFIREHSK